MTQVNNQGSLLKTESKEIDGNTYTVSQFTGREALKIKLKIVKMLAPVISSILPDDTKKDSKNIMDSEMDFSKIGNAVSMLMDSMSEDDFINFIMRLLAYTQRDNVVINENVFDMHFAGNLTTVYKVIYFVIQVNYPDFFQMGQSIGSLTEKFQKLR